MSEKNGVENRNQYFLNRVRNLTHCYSQEVAMLLTDRVFNYDYLPKPCGKGASMTWLSYVHAGHNI